MCYIVMTFFFFHHCTTETKPACEFAVGTHTFPFPLLLEWKKYENINPFSFIVDIQSQDSNTRLADPSTPYRFKNYMMLNTCYIDEDPNTLKMHSHQKHECSPFLLVGHNLEVAQRNKKTELSLIYSTAQSPERALWVTDIHGAICGIYSSINNDLMNYGWQHQYRRGTLFHAVYTLNHELVRRLLSDLNATTKSNDDSKETAPFELNESLKDIGGHNLLHLAVAVNNVDFIEDHGTKFNPDDTDQNGWSALRITVDNDNVESMKVLMDDLRPDLDEYYPEDKVFNFILTGTFPLIFHLFPHWNFRL